MPKRLRYSAMFQTGERYSFARCAARYSATTNQDQCRKTLDPRQAEETDGTLPSSALEPLSFRVELGPARVESVDLGLRRGERVDRGGEGLVVGGDRRIVRRPRGTARGAPRPRGSRLDLLPLALLVVAEPLARLRRLASLRRRPSASRRGATAASRRAARPAIGRGRRTARRRPGRRGRGAWSRPDRAGSDRG